MKKRTKVIEEVFVLLIISLMALFLLMPFAVNAADPVGPDSLSVVANETKGAASAQMLNISGGRIATLNLNATIQNPRWKGFVGNVTGKFTLDDVGGSTLFDWTLTSITGRIYSTRNSTSVTWASITCSNNTHLRQEEINMNHTNPNDNITKTFNATNDSATSYGSHNPFWVGSVYISANSCPTLNTYVNDVAQNTNFEEMALYDTTNIVYATIMEEDVTGFDGATYDFQMIVPENGLPSFSGATAYYIYVELGT